MGRFILGVLLSASLAICGFAAGTWAGGRFLVPTDQGLAGPTEAMAYGALTALGFLLAGSILAFVLRGSALRFLTLIAFIAAAIIVSYVMWNAAQTAP